MTTISTEPQSDDDDVRRHNISEHSGPVQSTMPTILRIGPYRLFFVSLDSSEPPHVHVQRERMVAKFWLEPLVLERAGGFRPHELSVIGRLVEENRNILLERWNEHFGR